MKLSPEYEKAIKGHANEPLIRAILAEDPDRLPPNLVLTPQMFFGDTDMECTVDISSTEHSARLLQLVADPDVQRVLMRKMQYPGHSVRQVANAVKLNVSKTYRIFTELRKYESLERYFAPQKSFHGNQNARKKRESEHDATPGKGLPAT